MFLMCQWLCLRSWLTVLLASADVVIAAPWPSFLNLNWAEKSRGERENKDKWWNCAIWQPESVISESDTFRSRRKSLNFFLASTTNAWLVVDLCTCDVRHIGQGFTAYNGSLLQQCLGWGAKVNKIRRMARTFSDLSWHFHTRRGRQIATKNKQIFWPTAWNSREWPSCDNLAWDRVIWC